jgi:hypothetical protein
VSAGEEEELSFGLSFHPLAPQNPVPTPSVNPPVRLIGFIGPAYTGDRIRVYTDLSFSSYYELGAEAIVQSSAVDAEDANSPAVVWVDGGALVEFVRTSTIRGSAAYVTGAIRRQLRAASSANRARFAPLAAETWELRCWPTPPPPPQTNWECPHSEVGMPGCHPTPFCAPSQDCSQPPEACPQ